MFRFVLFAAVIFMPLYAQAQIDSLFSNGILTENGKMVLGNWLDRFPEPRPSVLLAGLSELYGKEMLDRTGLYEKLKTAQKGEVAQGENTSPSSDRLEEDIVVDAELVGLKSKRFALYPPMVSGFGIEGEDLVPYSQSVLGKNLFSLSAKLVRLGLIRNEDREDFLGRIKGEIVPEQMMLSYFSFLVEEREKQPERQRKVKQFYETLMGLELIRSNKQPDFTGLEDPFDLFAWSNHAVIFAVDDLPEEAPVAFEVIYNRISELVDQEILLKKFEFQIEDEPGSEKHKIINARVVLENKGKVYTDTMWYNYAGGKTSIEEGMRTRLNDKIVNLVNEVLVANDAPARLYLLSPGRPSDKTRKALLALSPEQYFTLCREKGIEHIWGPHPELSLSSRLAEGIIQEALELGIIDQEAIPKLIREDSLLTSSILQNSTLGFPEFFLIDSLDNKMILELFSKASGGDYLFTDVKAEKEENDQFLFRFKSGNTFHEVNLSREKNYDYELIKYLSKEVFAKAKNNFHYVGHGNNAVGIYYLNSQQKKWIERTSYNVWVSKF